MKQAILLLILALFTVIPSQAIAASATGVLTATPAASSLAIGEETSVQIKVNPNNTGISAISVKIDFSTNLSYVSADTAGSAFSIEATPVQATGNTLFFERLSSQENGITTNGALILSLRFKGVSAGSGAINFQQANSELLAWEDNSNVLSSVQNTSITINNPSNTSSSSATSTPATASTATPTPKPASTSKPAATQSNAVATASPVTSSNGTLSSSPTVSPTGNLTTSPTATPDPLIFESLQNPTTSPDNQITKYIVLALGFLLLLIGIISAYYANKSFKKHS